MKLHRLLYGILIFSLFLVGGMFILANITHTYSFDVNQSSFNATHAKINEVYDISVEMKDDTIGAELEGGTNQVWEQMTTGPYTAVKSPMASTFGLISTLVQDAFLAFRIPPFFGTFIITGIVLFVVFGAIYLIMRYKP